MFSGAAHGGRPTKKARRGAVCPVEKCINDDTCRLPAPENRRHRPMPIGKLVIPIVSSENPWLSRQKMTGLQILKPFEIFHNFNFDRDSAATD
jgi:hypothetical protein